MDTTDSPIETTSGDKSRPQELILRVRATTKATRNAIQGRHGNAMKVSVQAPPENGKANKAIRKLLARKLDLRAAQVELKSGKTSRDKRFLIDGLNREELEARIAALLEEVRR